MKNVRSLYWAIILYDDSENLDFNSKIKIISQNYDYLYIKHDKDTASNGDLKKVHYHVILKFKNYKWLNALSNELGISPNYFEKINSLNNMLCYLIHFNAPDKYQYNFDDVMGSLSLKLTLKKCINNIDYSEEDKILIILDFIYSSNFLTYKAIVNFVLKNGLWSEFRRNSSIIFKLLEEHNSLCYNQVKE